MTLKRDRKRDRAVVRAQAVNIIDGMDRRLTHAKLETLAHEDGPIEPAAPSDERRHKAWLDGQKKGGVR